MPLLYNRARMTTATTGTGTITLGSAVSGYQSFADAGVSDADIIRYVIEDGNDWEIGNGTYTASGTTLTRTVLESSNADAAISLSGDAEVYIDAAAEDLLGSDRHDTLAAGFDSSQEDLGTVTSGTITPEVDADDKPNFKKLTNGGAFTLAPPSTSSACTIRIRVTNNGSAGAITTSSFDKVNDPDGYATTNAKEYYFYIDHDSARDVLTIREIV